jgi:hypothetical protein
MVEPDMKRRWLNLFWVVFLVAALVAPFIATQPAHAAETVYLYPNAAGDASGSAIPSQFPSSGAHWDKVDEVTPDDFSTYVYRGYTGETGYYYDLYNLTDFTEVAAINYIKVWVRCRADGGGYAGIKIKTGGSEYLAGVTDISYPVQWYNISYQWNTNPKTSVAWATSDLSSLQVGPYLYMDAPGYSTISCTQTKVEVNYTLIVPSVTTTAASSAETTGTLNGNITAINDTDITDRGFVWDISSHGNPGNVAPASSGYASNWTESDGFGTGAFSHEITVSPGTTYYIRACAENDDGNWGYGSETTLGVPLIIANDASNIAGTTARFNSTVSSDGGGTCQVRWGYGETSKAAEDFEEYDHVTDWTGSYSTGNHPYYDASDLDILTTYYYRMQIKNSTSTVTSTDEIDFETTSGVTDPSLLKAVPSATSMSLTWTKGEGTTDSVVRCRMDTYPTSYTDGQSVYQGTSSSYNFTGLTPGTTYYIRVWGKSGAYYSSGYAQVLATTSGAPPSGGSLEGPTEPSGWFSAGDYTNLSNLPLIYDAVNGVADVINMPRGNFWMILWVGVSVGLGFGFYGLAKGSALAGLGALTVALAFGWATIKLPMWMPAFTLIFCIGAFLFKKRES